MIWFFSAYLLLGIACLIVMAYDPYTEKFDFRFDDYFLPPIFIGFLFIITSPYLLPKNLLLLWKERKYIKDWKEKGTFTKKL